MDSLNPSMKTSLVRVNAEMTDMVFHNREYQQNASCGQRGKADDDSFQEICEIILSQ